VLTRATTARTDPASSEHRLPAVADDAAPTGGPATEQPATAETSRPAPVERATALTEYSREFVFADDDEDAAEAVAMHSAWSLEEMRRERARVDAFLTDELQAMVRRARSRALCFSIIFTPREKAVYTNETETRQVKLNVAVAMTQSVNKSVYIHRVNCRSGCEPWWQHNVH